MSNRVNCSGAHNVPGMISLELNETDALFTSDILHVWPNHQKHNFLRWQNVTVNNAAIISTRSCVWVSYCPSLLDVRSVHFKISLQTKGWHHRPTGGSGNHWIWLHFPVSDLEYISGHSLHSVQLFNHLLSWYVKWRTSAVPSHWHRLPPVPFHHPSNCVWPPGGPLLQAWAQTLKIPY